MADKYMSLHTTIITPYYSENGTHRKTAKGKVEDIKLTKDQIIITCNRLR